MRPPRVALSMLTVLGAPLVAPRVAAACEPVTLTTYNTAFVVAPASTEAKFHRSHADRAAVMATQILAERPDVIALQEVFDDDARDVFEDLLAAEYPFYVKFLDTDDDLLPPNDLHGDSGLMLFSRFPFLPFERAPLAGDVIAMANGRRWRHVTFLEFGAKQGWDRLANKGVGMVKIAGPCERQLAVAFTHLQASYDDDDAGAQARAVEIRAEQVADIRDQLWFGLSDNEHERVEMYVLGDLNIDANPNTAPVLGAGETEWQRHFDPNASGDPFFKSAVIETWPVEPDRRDVALTEGAGMPSFRDPRDGHRFDYVLRRAAPHGPATCVQHVRVDRAIGVEADGTSLSDHLPVTASTHRAHAFCSPHDARPVALPNDWINDRLEAPGMMQWYRIDTPGSYTIDISRPDIGFDVYAANDLSRPLRPSRPIRTDWGWRFQMPEAPFYIRVRGVTRAAEGDYTLLVHKNQGGHPQDAILLRPAVIEPFFMPRMPLNGENAVWFTFDTDVSDAGELPVLSLRALSFSLPFTLQIFRLDSNGNPIPVATPTMEMAWTWPASVIGNPLLDAGEYYVKAVPWWNTWWPGMDLFIRFDTSLTYATPDTVSCHMQDDNFGSDDIWLDLHNDGRSVFNAWRYLREFVNADKPHPMSASRVGVQRFNFSLHVELWETDDGPNGNDLVGRGTVPALAPDDPTVETLHQSRWRMSASDYSMRWRLSHTPPAN